MKLNPLDDRVVVQPSDAEDLTAGGIVLPDAAKEKPQRGTVVAVGPGRLLDSGERCPLSVGVGDEVLFAKYGGTDIEVDGAEVLILRESDILAAAVAPATDSGFQDVRQQVRQWPVELRQELADEIDTSIASDLAESVDHWDESRNARRVELIDRDIDGTISNAERRELDLLTRQLRAYRDRVAPIPMEGARQLYRQLLQKKHEHDEADKLS